VRLEHPALKEREAELRENVSLRREIFIEDIIYAHDHNYLDLEYLSSQLEHYEEAAQMAVEGNLALVNTSLSISDGAFPPQAQKWDLMEAIFFAATICTTIGESYNFSKS
jgi:hypothetical protein